MSGSHLHVGDLCVQRSLKLLAVSPSATIEGCVTLDCGEGNAGGQLKGFVLRGMRGTAVAVVSGVWELTECAVQASENACGVKVSHAWKYSSFKLDCAGP